MLFKKNKPEQPQEPDRGGSGFPSAGRMGSQSVFAPGLNPHAAPIDFGFDRIPAPPQQPSYIVPAPPPDILSQPQDQPDWEASPSDAFQDAVSQSVSPMQESWEAPPAPPTIDVDYVEPSANWQAPVQPDMGAFNASVAPPAFSGDAFEPYPAQTQNNIELEFEAAMNWQPPVEPIGASAASSGGTDFVPTQDFQEWTPPLHPEPSLPDYQPSSASMSAGGQQAQDFALPTEEFMPWQQADVPPATDDFPAFGVPSPESMISGGLSPGGQVSMSPGELLDTMHQQLYPEDPFGSVDLAEGQQAFEEAAQFLFPDTMNASLDWQVEDTPGNLSYGATDDFQMPTDFALSMPPVELGPSVQQDDSAINDISSLFPGEVQQASQTQPADSMFPATDAVLPEPVAGFQASDLPGFEMSPSLALSAFENPEVDLSSTEYFVPENDVSEVGNLPDMADFGTPESFVLENLPEHPGLTDDFNVLKSAPIAESSSEFSPADAFEGQESLTWETGTTESGTGSVSGFSEDLTPPSFPNAEFPTGAEPLGFSEDVIWTPDSQFQSFVAGENALFEQAFSVEHSEVGEQAVQWPSDESMNEENSPLLEESLMPLLPVAPEEEYLYSAVGEADQGSADAVFSDQDFYATEFTLNEQGELVPVTDETSTSLPFEPTNEGAGFGFADTEINLWQAESLSPTETFTPESSVEPISEFQAEFSETFSEQVEFIPQEVNFESPLPSVEHAQAFYESPQSNPLWDEGHEAGIQSFTPEPDFAEPQPQPPAQEEPVSPFARVSMPAIPPKMNAAPNAAPSIQPESSFPVSAPPSGPSDTPDALESQWHAASLPAAESASTTQPGMVTPPSAFTLDSLEVLGVCPLSVDRRLLVVHSNGTFALMGQVGAEQPNISVLKIFDSNPLAYQNTFTAVAEAHAAAQGMFVVQVGIWHAIISTFQDKITLHTELG